MYLLKQLFKVPYKCDGMSEKTREVMAEIPLEDGVSREDLKHHDNENGKLKYVSSHGGDVTREGVDCTRG